MKRILTLILAWMAAASLTACASPYPDNYSAEAISAAVIDVETQQPLEGVVVVANWQLRGGMEGGSSFGSMMVMEAVTDQHGRFTFPAWGPGQRPKGVYLKDEDPQLLLFKLGYVAQVLNNNHGVFWTERRGDPVRRSILHGKTIEMKLFKGTEKEYASHLSILHTAIEPILANSNDCNWKKIPRLMLAIDKLGRDFRTHGVYSPLYSINNLSERACGSPRKFFDEFKP